MSHFNGVVLMFRQEPVTLVKLNVLTAQLKCGARHLDTPPSVLLEVVMEGRSVLLEDMAVWV